MGKEKRDYGGKRLIKKNMLSENFSDKYKCDNILGVFNYGGDNSAIIEKIRGYKDSTIELLIKYDIVKMIGKDDWIIKDVTEIFRTRKADIMKKLYSYTGEDEKTEKKNSRSEKIFKSLYEDDSYDSNGDLKKSESLVNFINEYMESEKDYQCEVFFNDKPIVIYQSELEKIKEISHKYRVNEKDGRRIVRFACLLLAWQKADQNKYYNHREYAVLKLDNLLPYNPIVEVDGRADSDAMMKDFRKLTDDKYFEKIIPEVAAPRDVLPDMYYRLTFCVNPDEAENEKVALTITDFENLWEQIFVAAFGEFDVLEQPKEKDIKIGIIKAYDKKSKNGRVFIEDKGRDYPFSTSGKFSEGDSVKVFIIDSKKNKVQILKRDNERVYVKYKAVKRCFQCGKIFYAKQMGNGAGKCDKCNNR